MGWTFAITNLASSVVDSVFKRNVDKPDPTGQGNNLNNELLKNTEDISPLVEQNTSGLEDAQNEISSIFINVTDESSLYDAVEKSEKVGLKQMYSIKEDINSNLDTLNKNLETINQNIKASMEATLTYGASNLEATGYASSKSGGILSKVSDFLTGGTTGVATTLLGLLAGGVWVTSKVASALKGWWEGEGEGAANIPGVYTSVIEEAEENLDNLVKEKEKAEEELAETIKKTQETINQINEERDKFKDVNQGVKYEQLLPYLSSNAQDEFAQAFTGVNGKNANYNFGSQYTTFVKNFPNLAKYISKEEWTGSSYENFQTIYENMSKAEGESYHLFTLIEPVMKHVELTPDDQKAKEFIDATNVYTSSQRIEEAHEAEQQAREKVEQSGVAVEEAEETVEKYKDYARMASSYGVMRVAEEEGISTENEDLFEKVRISDRLNVFSKSDQEKIEKYKDIMSDSSKAQSFSDRYLRYLALVNEKRPFSSLSDEEKEIYEEFSDPVVRTFAETLSSMLGEFKEGMVDLYYGSDEALMSAYGVDSSSPNMSFLPIYASSKSFLTSGEEMFREGEKMAEVLYKLQSGEAVAINPETGKVYTDEEDWFKIAEEVGTTGVSQSADFLGNYEEVDRDARDYSANRASFIHDQQYGKNPSDYLSEEQMQSVAEQVISAIAEKNDITLTQEDLSIAVLSLADLICTSDEDVTSIVLSNLNKGTGGGAVPASQTD